MEVSVILPVLNEGGNLDDLLRRLREILERHGLSYEFVVVDGGSRDNTRAVAAAHGARVLDEDFPGYAGALLTGFRQARGDYLLTLDADLSHEPAFVAKMWQARNLADIVIASRYVRGGIAYTSFGRRALSRLLNVVLRRMLSVPVRDLSSGYRLYRREVVEQLQIEGRNFEVLEEILVKAYAAGFSITEVPFTYFPRHRGVSHARLVRFGLDLAKSSFKLWKLRNSLESADYDARAFYSLIPPQRYWQRARHHIITSWARGSGLTLDSGCGSSMIVQSLTNAIALDYSFAKTRYLHRLKIPAVRGSAFALPFTDETFDCVISSQVIEHIARAPALFEEMWRVLRPGGRLIIGTPDYATWQWRTIEPLYGMLLPWAYRDEHITHYTREDLAGTLERMGFVHEETAYIAGAELIMRYHKPQPVRVTEQAPAIALAARPA
ncbi:MAG TPA: glycosyltransferase [Candidatus Binataceae bacterium]|nr:glycosyltransferase [Candidatus Binataceae bacterium]